MRNSYCSTSFLHYRSHGTKNMFTKEIFILFFGCPAITVMVQPTLYHNFHSQSWQYRHWLSNFTIQLNILNGVISGYPKSFY